MSESKNTPINSDKWREGYTSGQKSFFSSNAETHHKRLKKMTLFDQPRDAKILDVGCGDGNLITFLMEQGFVNVHGIEPDAQLVADSPHQERIKTGSASSLPFEDESFDTVIIMAALHHLENDSALARSFSEFHRVLKPGGLLTYCEPSNSMTRRVLTSILMSPLSSISKFSKAKKTMVLDEWDTLNWWLKIEKDVPEQLKRLGFKTKHLIREPIKTFLVCHKIKKI